MESGLDNEPADAAEGWVRITTLERTLGVLVLGSVGMAVLLALAPAAGHDQIWFLMMAGRWLHGAQLYGPEAFDSNPPGAIWASGVPVWLAERTGGAATAVAKLLVVLLEVGVAAVCWRVLRRVAGRMSRVWALGLAFAFVVVFGVVPARDFGQRDALTAVLLLPYVLASAVEGGVGAGLGLLAGVMAGIGVCLKPQQALVVLAVEAVLLVRQRRGTLRRVEPWVVVGVGAEFVGAIRLFAPLYFSGALPILRETYWAIGHLSFWELMGQAVQLHGLMVAAVGLCVAGWLPGVGASAEESQPGTGLSGEVVSEDRGGAVWRVRAVVSMLVVAGLAATAAYYVQGTGWYYQQLPGISFFAGAVVLEGLVLARGLRWRCPRWLPYAADGLAVLALGLTMHFSGFPLRWNAFDEDRTYGVVQPDPVFFAGLAPGTSVATLTTSVEDAMMPVARYRLTWGQRMNNLWLLPAVLRLEKPGGWAVPARHRLAAERTEALAAMQRRWMVEDLERWQPQVVLVERCQDPAVRCQELEDRHDDLLDFFLEDAGFARVWTRYRWVRRSGAYDEYVLVGT